MIEEEMRNTEIAKELGNRGKCGEES